MRLYLDHYGNYPDAGRFDVPFHSAPPETEDEEVSELCPQCQSDLPCECKEEANV